MNDEMSRKTPQFASLAEGFAKQYPPGGEPDFRSPREQAEWFFYLGAALFYELLYYTDDQARDEARLELAAYFQDIVARGTTVSQKQS